MLPVARSNLGRYEVRVRRAHTLWGRITAAPLGSDRADCARAAVRSVCAISVLGAVCIRAN